MRDHGRRLGHVHASLPLTLPNYEYLIIIASPKIHTKRAVRLKVLKMDKFARAKIVKMAEIGSNSPEFFKMDKLELTKLGKY